MLYRRCAVETIQMLRERLRLTQAELAEQLGVSFASVNRWENCRAIPGRQVQQKLLEVCDANGIVVADLVRARILAEADALSVAPERTVLYHGSKSGLTGDIAPKSREYCDFGAGFYMGSEPLQPLTLICGFEQSRFYIVSADLSALSVKMFRPDLDWAMYVAYHRGQMEAARGTPLFEKCAGMDGNADIVVGSIANDRMYVVLDDFFQGNLTDTALIESLSVLQPGVQYVARTARGCAAVRVEKEIPLLWFERQSLSIVNERNRAFGIETANQIRKSHRRDGRYFDEIIAEAKVTDEHA